MNRQAAVLKSVKSADNVQAGNSVIETGQSLADDASAKISSLADDGKELAKRSVSYAKRTIEENPTLVLAGVVAVGAIAAMALMPRRNEPRSIASKMQRDLVRHTRDMRNAVRDEIRSSGAGGRIDDLSRSLASFDWKPYIQPLVEQASALAQQANEKLTAKSK